MDTSKNGKCTQKTLNHTTVRKKHMMQIELKVTEKTMTLTIVITQLDSSYRNATSLRRNTRTAYISFGCLKEQHWQGEIICCHGNQVFVKQWVEAAWTTFLTGAQVWQYPPLYVLDKHVFWRLTWQTQPQLMFWNIILILSLFVQPTTLSRVAQDYTRSPKVNFWIITATCLTASKYFTVTFNISYSHYNI